MPPVTRIGEVMPLTSNKERIRRAFDAWAAGTGGVFDLLARNARWTINAMTAPGMGAVTTDGCRQLVVRRAAITASQAQAARTATHRTASAVAPPAVANEPMTPARITKPLLLE